MLDCSRELNCAHQFHEANVNAKMDVFEKLERWEQMQFWDIVKDLGLHKYIHYQVKFNVVGMVVVLGICAAILGKMLIEVKNS